MILQCYLIIMPLLLGFINIIIINTDHIVYKPICILLVYLYKINVPYFYECELDLNKDFQKWLMI